MHYTAKTPSFAYSPSSETRKEPARKKCPREILEACLSRAAIFFSRVLFASRSTDSKRKRDYSKSKHALTVVVLIASLQDIGSVIAGVLKSWFVQPMLDPDYYSNITEATDNEWKGTHGGKNVSESIKDYLVTYIGEPLSKLLRYC